MDQQQVKKSAKEMTEFCIQQIENHKQSPESEAILPVVSDAILNGKKQETVPPDKKPENSD